ncbi:MAG: polymer-forming cytoskeletal protein [Kiritimatiellae bacterium]|nr:polymer-forming cytoskeletal protein [Kiritimatiellia bacterium]
MDERETILTADVEITGRIESSGPIRFDGKLKGDLICSKDVTVGKSATINGSLSVGSVVILGEVIGNITAEDKIDMQPTARVKGDIKAKRLAVEDGVSFVGGSQVNPRGAAGGGR